MNDSEVVMWKFVRDISISLTLALALIWCSSGCASHEKHVQRPSYMLVLHDFAEPYEARYCARTFSRIICADTYGLCDSVRIYEQVTSSCSLSTSSR